MHASLSSCGDSECSVPVMARPKMTVAAALSKGRELGDTPQPIAQEALGFTAVTARDVGAKQAVKLGNGTVVHMRAKKATTTTSLKDRTPEVKNEPDDDDRFNHKTPLQESSVKVESPVDDSAGSSQQFEHPHVTPQARPQETQNFGEQEGGAAEFMCTACGYSVAIAEVRAHPVLHVGVCGACYGFLFSSPFTKDNPQDPSEHENECRWCGDGGEIVLCDTCPKAFCKSCINRNFGAGVLKAIETLTRQWRCFVCDDNLLQSLIRECKSLQALVKTMNRSGPPPKRRTMREHYPRPRGPSMNQTTFPDDTIAIIIAREKAKMQRKHPGRRFTGFEVQNHRRPKQSRHSLFSRTRVKSEHGTSNQSSRISEVHLV